LFQESGNNLSASKPLTGLAGRVMEYGAT